MPEFEIKLLITADSPEEALEAVALGLADPTWIRNATEGQFWLPVDNYRKQKPSVNGKHQHDYEWSNYCGAEVCLDEDCNHHKGLARCYCGWSASGGNGRQELREMGEQIEED